MGRAREMGWMAAGLMIGAGACYCVYKLTVGKDDNDKPEEEEDEWGDDQELDDDEPKIWFNFTAMARPWNEDRDWTEPGAPGGTEDRPSGGGKANRAHPMRQRPFPYEHKNTWSAQSFKNISYTFELSRYPPIPGRLLFSEPKDAAFSQSCDVHRHSASPSVTGSSTPTPHPTGERKALCAPDHLNGSIENRGQIKMYADEVCRETVSPCCNSFLQQAGLNLLISMTVINNMLAKSASDLKFPLLSEGSGCAQVQLWKLLKGLSEKPVLAGQLLGVQVLFPVRINRSGNRELLLEMLTT
ncbi:PREDICTED: protein ARMCX6 [Chinchilla lanigera]|uniref:Armadillo repeat containing X-linked 6 n=1 Tax=Chinchilla lanigera TaxID=34839 RepID=A0A8C2UP56_CHILA|nr:PREDICTED: protein ARMCX6 [Chinchilla lanigera]XP_013361311.1 PREDICTED: protein ARMCX6 [Chinchilla lanigera]XP_013361312.1 PREDICTED: protein ARMCX6 [Chinchilla lanigera]XP_013361313.1 PREDICTED: protein ARMCX6 [Chinchilla lanigera]